MSARKSIPPPSPKRQKTEEDDAEASTSSARKVCVTATTLNFVRKTRDECVDMAIKTIREAVLNAPTEQRHIVLLPELFSGEYFPSQMDERHFDLAEEYETSKLLEKMSVVAKKFEVVLPISFFERSGQAFFNSVCVIDANGEKLGVYRKSHIPMSPGYEEKFFFSPGDTGFKVFETKYARIGVGICWDQWFPEAARCMALQGAELLLYPTAIGSEPQDAELESGEHWRRVMQGHAAANMVPVVASNRNGVETSSDPTDETVETEIEFYGGSFICNETGEVVRETNLPEDICEDDYVQHTFDLDVISKKRASWGLFRDRRPDLYKSLLSLDGK